MKKIRSYIFAALMGLSVTSCNDFLTLMPLNEVVLENFWTNESDVESVLRGAYASLEEDDCIQRMSAWGEMRSDNIVTDNTISESQDLTDFVSENFNSQNPFTKYLCFYKTINYANTVLYYAPEVQKKDPNYHGSELAKNQAEAIAIRSLCYWYLIRAYRDVPYTTAPSIDDTRNYFIGATPFNQILDSLINDLERVKDNAPVHYSSEIRSKSNSSRFTRVAIYAMLADMYLWKGDWENCIDCCKYITESKLNDYQELAASVGSTNMTVEKFLDRYPLISEITGGEVWGNSYNEIFGDGASFETLFELPYDRDHETKFFDDYYNDQNSTTGKIMAHGGIQRGEGKLFSKFDSRFYQCVSPSPSGNKTGIMKYVYQVMEYSLKDGAAVSSPGERRSSGSEASWIIYRYTDVLLMEAEARVMQAKELGTTARATAELDTAFELVKVVNDRAICKNRISSVEDLNRADYSDVSKMEQLVLDERRRELMFEGKRWFDLVRMAMRDGNATRVSQLVSGKSENANSKAIAVKFKNLNGLFLPFHMDEIKINENLKQNPAYPDVKETQKAK